MIKYSCIKGAKIFAQDGEIGRVKDIYFDDRQWGVRYFVVDTGGWLTGRRVLVSPFGIEGLNNGRLVSNLTRRQIEECPPSWEHEPVSREYERQYHAHYNWPYYWTGRFATIGAAYPYMYSPDRAGIDSVEKGDPDPKEPHLRSAAEVRGYHLHASDGPIGHIEDFLLDDVGWVIRYLVVDTKNWWPGKKVLLFQEWIAAVDWDRSAVEVHLTRDTIKTAPEFDESALFSRKYEERLFEHYGRDPYWAEHAMNH